MRKKWAKTRQTACTRTIKLLLALDIQREQRQWTSLPVNIRLVLEGEGGRKSLCMMKVVHVNSVQEDKRLRTILDFEFFFILKKPFACPHSLTWNPEGQMCFGVRIIIFYKAKRYIRQLPIIKHINSSLVKCTTIPHQVGLIRTVALHQFKWRFSYQVSSSQVRFCNQMNYEKTLFSEVMGFKIVNKWLS